MYTQLDKVLYFIIALLSFTLVLYSSRANSVSGELKDIQETVRSFVPSFSIKDNVENMSPSIIIGLCIAIVILAVVFRGIIFFMVIFGLLVTMFSGTEKVADYLKEKFNLTKGIKLQSDSERKDKN